MSMHIVFMVSKYIIYVLSDFRDQIPLNSGATGGATCLRGGTTFLRGGATLLGGGGTSS